MVYTLNNFSEFKVTTCDLQYFSESDREKAHDLAILIQSAYSQFDIEKQNSSSKEWSVPSEYEFVIELRDKQPSHEEVFGFIAKKEREIFIIIRGTITAYEWYNNTVTSHIDYDFGTKNWGRATTGFFSIYADLRPEIKTALEKEKNNFDRVYVAGHSLGGALATLAIPDLLDSGIYPSNIIAYTFASPRCCDRVLANELNTSGVKHWRIANTEDIVPTLPGATANIFSTEEVANDNFIVKLYNNFRVQGMQTSVHTGIPIYFTIGTNSIQDNHNLEFVYMNGIGQPPASLT